MIPFSSLSTSSSSSSSSQSSHLLTLPPIQNVHHIHPHYHRIGNGNQSYGSHSTPILPNIDSLFSSSSSNPSNIISSSKVPSQLHSYQMKHYHYHPISSPSPTSIRRSSNIILEHPMNNHNHVPSVGGGKTFLYNNSTIVNLTTSATKHTAASTTAIDIISDNIDNNYHHLSPSNPPNTAKKRGRPPLKKPEFCSLCKAKETPEWRKAPDGKYVCNACGLQIWKKNKQLVLANKSSTTSSSSTSISSSVSTSSSSSTSTSPLSSSSSTASFLLSTSPTPTPSPSPSLLSSPMLK